MDIKELNKTQLILLTLLITFVVSIATGIITVSLMQQMPTSVPQTINNVIQRTIEKVTTIQAPALPAKTDTKELGTTFGDGDAIISIYSLDIIFPTPGDSQADLNGKALGQGIIISDMGLVLVDSSILTDKDAYKVILGQKYFDATILKKFANGFTILKITTKKEATDTTGTVKGATTDTTAPKVDIKP